MLISDINYTQHRNNIEKQSGKKWKINHYLIDFNTLLSATNPTFIPLIYTSRIYQEATLPLLMFNW